MKSLHNNFRVIMNTERKCSARVCLFHSTNLSQHLKKLQKSFSIRKSNLKFCSFFYRKQTLNTKKSDNCSWVFNILYYPQDLTIFVTSENTDKNIILIHFFLILLTFIESWLKTLKLKFLKFMIGFWWCQQNWQLQVSLK